MKEENNMNINRFNYEEYFLLYVDNELSKEDMGVVEQFAAEHPDLGQELKLLMQVVSRPEKHQVFTNKESLMKSSLAVEGINELNYEGYFISYLDDELTTPEKATVENFLYTHPELESAFEQFQQAKLVPEKIIFGSKENLYRHEKDRRIIPIGWWKMAGAAAVILMAGLLWLNQSQPGNPRDQLAVVDKTIPADSNKITGKRNDKTKPSLTSDATKKELPIKESNSANRQPSQYISIEENPPTAIKKMPAEITKHSKGLKIPGEQDKQQLPGKAIVQQAPLQQQISMTVAKVKVNEKNLALVQPAMQQEVAEDNNAMLTFASDQQSENVFLTNIPVDNNTVPLRGLFRKATRVINKVAALKNGHRTGISIGNVEIAIQ